MTFLVQITTCGDYDHETVVVGSLITPPDIGSERQLQELLEKYNEEWLAESDSRPDHGQDSDFGDFLVEKKGFLLERIPVFVYALQRGANSAADEDARPGTITVPFTQYLRPDGRTKEISIEMPRKIGLLARSLLSKGYYFSAEILTTDQVSLTCEAVVSGVESKIAAHIVCDDGPGVPQQVERLITEAWDSVTKPPTAGDD